MFALFKQKRFVITDPQLLLDKPLLCFKIETRDTIFHLHQNNGKVISGVSLVRELSEI